MNNNLYEMSQKELIELIEKERNNYDNLKEAYIEKILNNEDRASHFNFRQSIREDVNNDVFNINESFSKDNKTVETNFINDFKNFALSSKKLGLENYDDISITDWIKNGVYYNVDKNIIIAHSVAYQYSPLMTKHLLTTLPEDSISELSFEKNDLIEISKTILDTKYISIDYQKDALLFMKDIIVEHNDPSLLRNFHNLGKETLKNHINLYKDVFNKDIDIFDIKFEDVPFNKIISKIEKDISTYNLKSELLEKALSNFVDAGLFDKEIRIMSDNNFDIYSNVLKVKDEKEYKNINNVLEHFTKNDLKQDFARLLLIRETELVLDYNVDFNNKNKNRPKF